MCVDLNAVPRTCSWTLLPPLASYLLLVVCTPGSHKTILDVDEERTTSVATIASDSSSHVEPPSTPSGKDAYTYILTLACVF